MPNFVVVLLARAIVRSRVGGTGMRIAKKDARVAQRDAQLKEQRERRTQPNSAGVLLPSDFRAGKRIGNGTGASPTTRHGTAAPVAAEAEEGVPPPSPSPMMRESTGQLQLQPATSASSSGGQPSPSPSPSPSPQPAAAGPEEVAAGSGVLLLEIQCASEGWKYTMDPLQDAIVIGRKAKRPKQAEEGGGASSRPDIELTGSKAVSRRHAVITRQQGGEQESGLGTPPLYFELACEGKNNAYINRELLTSNDEPALLKGGDVLSIGGIILEVAVVASGDVPGGSSGHMRHDE
eukprot:COSAG05_NODE_1923_length_3830_cov_4.180113_4_plen_292_part_00